MIPADQVFLIDVIGGARVDPRRRSPHSARRGAHHSRHVLREILAIGPCQWRQAAPEEAAGAGREPHPGPEGPGRPMILIRHDLRQVFDLFDRIAVFRRGQILVSLRRD